MGEKYGEYKPLVWILGLAYGALNVFPNFGICFASIPLVIDLLCKICRDPKVKWYVLLFCYPFLSYFSYFGLFILGYMALFFLWILGRTVYLKKKNAARREDSKLPLRVFLAVCALASGCIVWEYRLFRVMLLGDEVTIRSTMEAGSFTLGEIVRTILEVFAKGMFHAESMHTYLVLPVCIVYFFFLNIRYIKDRNKRGIFHDLYNLLILALVFNSVVYGIYYWEGFRGLVEALCPPLTGWQFNRTVFFSPFLWYWAFFLVLKRFYDAGRKGGKVLANLLAMGALLLIVLSGTRYNDLYHPCRAAAYHADFFSGIRKLLAFSLPA